MKILLVEDDKELSLAICLRLKSYGYQPIPAPDAISAISLAVKHQPDLAIVDINLPGGDGFTVLDRLSGCAECALMPSILMTASKLDGLKLRASESIASHFLEKPFNAETLINAIDIATGNEPYSMALPNA